MKKKFVRLISAVLSAAMTLTAVPLSAFAEGEAHTHDGESNVITTPLDFREKTADENGAGWSWDHDTKTLTLNGVNIQATTEENMMSVVTVPDGTKIVLNGENTIVQTDTGDSDTYVLSAVNNKEVNCDGTMTISGDGVLNAENRSTDSMARSLGGSIILNGGTVNATGTVKTNSLEIHNDGVLNANATTASFEGVAVNVSGGITVDGNGSLTAVGCANESTLNSAILLTSNFDKISVSENGSITVPEGNAARVGIYYSGNNGDGMDAEISGGKVTAYGAKYGIYKVNLIMSGTGSVYTTGGSYAIGQTVPTIDENEFVIKGSTEFKASESAVTGEVKYNSGYYEIGGADAKTVVIKPDTSPRIILGKQTGIFKTEEYKIIEDIDMTDIKLKGTVYFDITLKNMSDEEFADARGYFGGDEPDLLASIIKTDYGWVCMVCDTKFSTTYDTDNTLTIKCGDIVSNTVQVKSNANRFNKVTQGDNTNRTVFYTNTSQEEKDNYKLVSTYTVDSESISYNWYSTNSAYSADELGAAVSGSNGEFKLADNIPAGNYVLYCDITYSDGDSTETVTEKFTFTYKECAHENGYSDGKCTNCGALCDHSNIDIDTGKCNECGRQFVATISTDGSAPTGCDTLADCLDSITADTGNYVKIYQDIGDTSATATLDTIDVKHNVMIDLNGHKLNNIKLGVNKDVTLTLTGTAGSYVTQVYVRKGGGSFIIDSEANVEFNTIFVEDSARLAVNDGAKVTTEQLTVIASVNDDGTTTTSVKLATGMKLGGLTYHRQNNSGALKLGNLLDVTRQTLRRDDNGNYLDLYKEYGSMGYPFAFTVVEHTDADHTYSNEDGKCDGCGKPCEHSGEINTDNGICSICGAVVSVAIYTDANGISKYVDADELHSLLNEYNGSGTIKLFKDYGNSKAQYDLYGELTIDLNGRQFNIRSITPCKNGKLTIKNSGNPVMLGCNVYPTSDTNLAGGTLIIDGDVVLDTSIYVYDSSTVILKDGTYHAGLYARDSKTLYDMLGEGKAFFKTDGTLFNASVKEISSSVTLIVKDHSHTYVDGKCECGYVCTHSNIDIDTGKCNECEYQYAAVIVKDGAVASVYEENEMGAAFETADSDANTGCTLKVYKNYTGSYTTLSGKFTLWIAEKANVGTLTVSGDITVTGSEKNNNIYGDFNVADGGKLTFDENCGAMGTVSVGAGTFDCYSTFGITLNINDASSDVILHYGTFKKICYNGGGDRANAEILTLLAENRMFMKLYGEPIDGSKTLLKDGFATTVVVIRHEDHGYDSTTGKCTICGKRCGHTDVDSKTGVCSICKYQFTAGISGVGTAKYFDNIDDAFTAALSEENSGCTLTLYKDCSLSTSATITNATVTVDVNGYSLGGEADISVNNGGVLYLKDSRKSTYYGCIDAPFSVNGGTLINGTADGGSSAADVLNLVINSAKRVEIYGGIFENVYIAHASGVALYGGRYNTICGEESNSTPVNDLLAKGYAFATLNSVTHLPESIVDGSAKTIGDGLTNVMVVAHEHRYNVETGKCPCGVCALAIFTETTQSSETYTFIESETQFKNIAENEADGVLKLTGDVDCIVKGIIINGNKTIDMNGHTLNVSVGTEEISAVAVYGNVTFENSGSSRAVINATGVYSYGMVTVNGDIEFDTFATFEDGDALINAGVFKSIYVQGRSVIEILGSGKALASESGEILNASVQQIYKAGDNIFVTAHPKHTYDDHGNCACGYKCLHDGEGQVDEDSANKVCSECGAKIYAKVTTADGKVKYFDDITEGLRYADKAENKGCVFTLVTSGEIKSEVTLSSGQFTITTATTNNNYVLGPYAGKITIDGADVIAEGDMFIRCKVNVKSGSLTLPEGSSTGFDSIAISGGTVTISEGVNADSYVGADNLFVSEDATDAKLTIGGGTYGNVYLGQFKLKDVIASGVRVISYDNPTDPTAEKTATALLYSDIAEKNNFDSENGTVSYYLVTKCEHKNEDGSYAFNDGVCKYCNSEFAASVSYTVDGSAKTELFSDICDAFDKANGVGTATVTLYKDITDSERTRDVTVMGNVTLELNGKTLGGRYGIARISVSDGGTLTVNGDGDMDTPIYVNENSKLVINGGGYFYSVSVKKGGNAEIGGGTIRGLSVLGNVKLSGGKFNDIEIFNGNLESVLADGYAYKVEGGTWLSIAERAEDVYRSSGNEDKPLSVEEAPIKSASIAWVGEEAPVIYRNGEKYLYVNITYELAVGSKGATYSDFVNGNNRIKDYNLYNKYMVHCYEIGKLAAKDGEVEYYIVLKCNGYEYKSNVLKLTLATCSHPEDSLLYENDGFVICSICDALIEAEVVDADGKSLGYADIESAIKLAQENEGSTVKLMSEGVSSATEFTTVTGGRFTVDFNGKKVFYQFDVNGGDVTFTSSVKQADVETLISGIEVNGTDAKVTIDGKIKLGSVTLTSGALAVNSAESYIKELSIIGGNAVIDNAIIGALQTNGGDTVINCVEANSLSININGSGSISIVTGTFYSTTCKTGLGMAIASGSRVYDSNMNGAIIYTYDAIQTMTKTDRIFVDKCVHKDGKGSYVLDGNPCPYCSEEIVATVSYTAGGSEETDLFSDICDAFDKANEIGTATVTLYKDITDDITDTIAVTGNVTLELNGKRLSQPGTDVWYSIEVTSGKLTVNGSGLIKRVAVRNGSNAEINGGTFSDFIIKDGGNAVIKGGQFYSLQVSGEGRNVGQLLADGYAYWRFIDSGIWSTIAEREKQDIANVEVKEAPIKSATITANDESPIIYRNGKKAVTFAADVTYTGNETLYVTGYLIDGTVIKEKTDLSGNRYYLFSGEVDKAVAEDGEIQYYCIFTYDGYEYKSNVVTLTVATCQHPGESVKCDDNGNVCGICNRALTASVELSDGTLSYYGNWNDAISAAQESEGCTLKLLNYSWLKDNETFDISKGRFTVDLNKNDSSGPFAFNVKGGDITFTALKKASISFTGVTVSGENANVLIDSKATLNYLVVNSGKVTVDGANIGTITIKGGDMVINDVNADYLSMKADTTGGSGYNVSIVSGTFNIFTCENESNYTLGRAIASGSRVIGLNAIVGSGFKYAEIQSMTKANYLNVIKCDHKDENDSYALDGNLCPYCNEEIAATVSYTADGGEMTDLFSDIYDAFAKANEAGTATVTLYKDIENSELTQGVTITGNVTLALNGKKLGGTFAFNAPVEVSDGGMFTVGGDGKMRMPIKAYANSKLIINGGEFTSVMVYIDGDAEIGGGVIDALTIIGNAKAKISGGKFYNIEIANGSLESVLADGYAYKKDGGAWLSIAERAESVYSSVNNDNKPVNVEEAPIKSATLSTEINKLYRNSNANPTLKFNLALAHGSNLNDSYVSKRYGINSYVSGDIIYSSLSALVKDAKLSADEIIDKAGNSVAAKIYFVVITDDGYEIKSNTVSIDLVDCDHSQVVDPTADKETAGNITEPTYCEICESKFNAKITKGDDVKYYNNLDEAAKDAQKSENEGCTLYPLYNKNGYGGQLVITEGNFTLKYAVRTAFSRPIIINGKAKLTVTGRCAVTAFENQDAFIVRGGDVTFDGLATGSNVTINGGNVTMAANNINCLTINGGNVSISSGGFAEIVTTVSDKVIADYIDPGFWVQDRGTKEWIDIYSLNKATASSTNGLTVRLCPMQIIKPIDTVYYTNGYYPDGIPSLQISAVPWYSGEVDAKVAYQWIAIDENGYETVIEGATDRKLSLENLTTGRYYCRLTYSNAATAGVSMKSDVVTATITECEHSGGEATCTKKAKCEICGAEYGEPLGHDYVVIKVVEPDYRNEGYSVFECTRCEDTYLGNYVPVKPIPDVEEIAVEKTTYNEVDISWKDISDVDGFNVECYVGDQWKKIDCSAEGDRAVAKLSGLSAGLKYKVRIVAYAGSVIGKYRYFYVDTVPSPVWNINTVKATDETVRISWNRNTRADGYKVEWYIDNQWSAKTVTGNNNIAAVIDGLCAGTRYKVRVSAYKGDLYSPYTYGYINTLPSKVTGITQTVTSSSFTLKWDKNESADGYTVQYYADGKWNEKSLVGNDKTTVTIGSLKGYKTYKVRIKAYKGELQSTFDDIYITTAPTKVDGLKVKSAVDSKAVVIWNADATADGYNVGYYIGGKWVEKTITDNKTAMAELDGLTPYSTYKVRVRAYKGNLYGDYSYTTVTAVLSPVTNIKVVSAKSNSITVKWGKNASADGYKVEIYKGGKWVKKTLKGSTNATVTIGGLRAGSVYKVRIASYKGANTSTFTYANVNTAK
ncbi:MAG: fibronectin type III domain-containing protein [[Eubacterium] siraeum]